MDNPKKKKLDAKRISRQKWEIAYIRAISREQLKKISIDDIGFIRFGFKTIDRNDVKKIKRICKACLKFVK